MFFGRRRNRSNIILALFGLPYSSAKPLRPECTFQLGEEGILTWQLITDYENNEDFLKDVHHALVEVSLDDGILHRTTQIFLYAFFLFFLRFLGRYTRRRINMSGNAT